jgi:predicted phage terminase large subunit-like protein
MTGLSRWIPHSPTAKQAEFLACEAREAFYGGAAGGGKSEALLMAALQYVELPDYAALLLRRTYAALKLPGALMDRAQEWLGPTAARFNAHSNIWTFPSGATLTFGYLENENDKYRYQSAEFDFIGFDELTQFSESQYTYLFSRLRRRTESTVPLRMRSASNPGGAGHAWARARFVDHPDDPQRIFIPARLADNPHLEQQSYIENLDRLSAVERAQLLEGDWRVHPEGVLFKREWFEVVESAPDERALRIRYWDKAATEGGGARSAGVLMAKTSDGLFCVEDVVCGQWSALQRERIMRQTAEGDGRRVQVWLEQEPGSGGKESAEASIRNLAGYIVHAERPTGDKAERAQPLAAQCEAGNVCLVRGAWNHDYLEEVCAFPLGSYADRVDASSGAFNKLAAGKREYTAEEFQHATANDLEWFSQHPECF